MKRLLNYIGSRRFAIILLIATLSVILLSNLLPNFSVMKAADIKAFRSGRPMFFALASYLQVGEVVRSPFFLILPAFMFISITACTLNRARKEGRREKRVVTGTVKHRVEYYGKPELLAERLRGKGWESSLETEGEGIIVTGVKGRNGFWGSMAFHAGMNVVFIGIALSLLTRFNGSVVLTDGYSAEFSDAFIGDGPKGFPLKAALMEGFSATYAEGFPVDYSMNLTLWTDIEEKKAEVKVNRPLTFRGYQFVPIRYNFSPRFVIKKDGIPLLDTYVTLTVMTPDQIDSFEVPGEGIKITTQFFPEFYKDGKAPKSRSREPKNPVFFIEAEKGKEKIGQGFLLMNKEVSFSGYSLEFKDIKMWVMFDVSRDLGVPVITLGFILIVTGLIIRFIWNERFVWVSLTDGFAEVGGRAGYFPALFEEELKILTEELKLQTTDNRLKSKV